MVIDIKNQFSRVFNREEPNVGRHLTEEPKKDYYSGIKVWGRQIKGGNNRD
jgi:hypothetical protein